MTVVLFDMDHTLVDINTLWTLGQELAKQGHLQKRTLAAVAVDQLLYGLGVRSLNEVMTHVHSLITGQDANMIQDLVDDLVMRKIAPTIFPQARQRIAEHRQHGDRVIIASASPDFLVGRVAKLVGISEWIATRHPIVDGKFAPLNPPGAWGVGKVELAKQAGLIQEKLQVYTDHADDFPLVAQAGFASLVNPSKALIQKAKNIPHEIVHWSLMTHQ